MSYYIYKICCDECPEFNYVGSTKAFRQRKNEHKKSCNNETAQRHHSKLYTTIRANGGWDNWRMVLIEECGEISFIEARIKEEEHRIKLNANLNSQRCHLTEEAKREDDNKRHKEYRENNKEYYRQKDKERYEKNKETLSEKGKEKITCDCGKVFRKSDKGRHEKSNFHQQFINNK